jgi:hypothetical protein
MVTKSQVITALNHTVKAMVDVLRARGTHYDEQGEWYMSWQYPPETGYEIVWSNRGSDETRVIVCFGKAPRETLTACRAITAVLKATSGESN